MLSKKHILEKDLAQTMAIFGNVINIEYIMVVHKKTGICMYFKAFRPTNKTVKFISGLLSKVYSFGTESETQEAVNKIKCIKKTVLISDGSYIRIAIVQTKTASKIYRKRVLECIMAIEVENKDVLDEWKGQQSELNNVEKIIDAFLDVSIILAHKIDYDQSKIDTLLQVGSKDVFQIANDLIEETNMHFIFIPTLIQEVIKRTNKSYKDTLFSIKNLRTLDILTPIDLSSFENKPLSKSYIDQLNICETNFSPEEFKKLKKYLSSLSPMQSDIFLYTLLKQKKIVSPPIIIEEEAVKIDSVKSAKKSLINLKKKIKGLYKKKDLESIKIYCKVAVKIATYWNLLEELEDFADIRRFVKIEEKKEKMEKLRKHAENSISANNLIQARQYFALAYDIGLDLYNHGHTDVYDDLQLLAKQRTKLLTK